MQLRKSKGYYVQVRRLILCGELKVVNVNAAVNLPSPVLPKTKKLRELVALSVDGNKLEQEYIMQTRDVER